jgi:hypothetical protein
MYILIKIYIAPTLTCSIKYKGKYSPETRGRIKRVRYGLDMEEI